MVEDSPDRENYRRRGDRGNGYWGDGKGSGKGKGDDSYYSGKGASKGGKADRPSGGSRAKGGPASGGPGRRPVSKKPVMCKFYKNGGCSKTETCPYAHGDEELARIRAEEEQDRGYRGHEADEPPSHSRRGEKGGASSTRPSRQRPSQDRAPARRSDWRHEEHYMSRRQQETHESSMNNDGVPEREPPLPRDSIKSSTLQHMGHMIQCRHAPKGCGKLLTKDELPAHLEKCPFERCKEQLANGRIDPIIKYFKKQIAERDTAIQDLRAQVSQNFKEEEESYGLEEAHISDFKDLVFKGLLVVFACVSVAVVFVHVTFCCRRLI